MARPTAVGSRAVPTRYVCCNHRDPTDKGPSMMQVLFASHNGELYKTTLRSVDDIAEIVRDRQLETLTNRDGIEFWFTPSTHRFHHRVNRKATEIFLATTRFTASTVPLLRGIVVLTAHDAAGELTGLSDAQVNGLAATCGRTPWREELVLTCRISRDQRTQLRACRAAAKAEAAAVPRIA